MPEFKIERADARGDGADNAGNGVDDVVVGAGRLCTISRFCTKSQEAAQKPKPGWFPYFTRFENN
jgi:hypothetical protein